MASMFENLAEDSPETMVLDRRHGPQPSSTLVSCAQEQYPWFEPYDKLVFRAYHGLDMTDGDFDEPGGWGDWAKMEKLTEDIWPEVRSNAKDRTQCPRKVTRGDWNDL